MNTDRPLKNEFEDSQQEHNFNVFNHSEESKENADSNPNTPRHFRRPCARTKTVTLSKVPVFHQSTLHMEKDSKQMSNLDKLRHFILQLIEGVYFHICVLCASIYSLFMADIRMLAVPPSADVIFYHINESIFFFFLCEFLLMLFSKKKFLGSFFFYLDIVSLFSLLPETPLIWTPLMSAIADLAGENSGKLNEVLSNSHLAKTSRASQAGSKASNYLRLLRLINFIKVIRVAKMVESTKSLKNRDQSKLLASGHAIAKMRKRKSFVMGNEEMKIIELAQKIPSNSIIQRLKQGGATFAEENYTGPTMNIYDRRKKTEIIKLSDKNELAEKQEPLNRHSISSQYKSGKLRNIPLHRKLQSHAVQKSHNRSPSTNDTPVENNTQRDVVIYPHKVVRVNTKSEGIYKNIPDKSNQLDDGFEKITVTKNPLVFPHIDQIPKEGRYSIKHIPSSKFFSLFSADNDNDFKFLAKSLTIGNSLAKPIVEKYIAKEELKESQNNLHSSLVSESGSDIMDQIEEEFLKRKMEQNKIFTLEANKAKDEDENREKQKKISESTFVETIKDKENEAELIKRLASSMNSKMEKRLSEGITKIIVVVVMLLLVAVPILDFEFLDPLVNDNDAENIHHYCLDLIYEFMNKSLEDESYLSGLNYTISYCMESPEFIIPGEGGEIQIEPQVRRFLLMNFTESEIFHLLQNKTGLLHNVFYVAIPHLHEFEANYREEEDFKKEKREFDENNSISFMYDVSEYNRISSITGIVKSLYVAVILIVAAYISSVNVNKLVITPLDKIFTKLNMNLQHLDIYELREKKYLEVDYELNAKGLENDIFDNSFEENIDSTSNRMQLHAEIKDKNRETDYIDKAIKTLLDLISLSIGKSAYLLIPNSDLEKKLHLKLEIPCTKFQGIILLLQLSNTSLFYEKYGLQSSNILNKVNSLFHSIGIIFNGEPYFKGGSNTIIFKKGKIEWLMSLKKYAIDILDRRKATVLKLKKMLNNMQISKEEIEIFTFYDNIILELAVLCGIRFLFSLHKNLSHTLQSLQQCGVKLNLVMNYGDIYYGYTGTEDILSEIYTGPCVEETKEIAESLSLSTTFPSLFLTEAVFSELEDAVKKGILPYEYLVINDNKKLVYRQFFDYSIFLPGSYNPRTCTRRSTVYDPTKDAYNFTKIKNDEVFKERRIFESTLLHDGKSKEAFITRFLKAEPTFLQITSKLDPTFKSLLYCAYYHYNSLNSEKCLEILNDSTQILKKFSAADPVLASQLTEFHKSVTTISQKTKKMKDDKVFE